PLVAAMGELAIEQEAEPVGMAECGSLTRGFEFGKGLSHSRKPELAQLVKRRMGQQDVISSVVVARSADIGVEDRHAIGGWRLWGLAVELVVEDGGHRAGGQGGGLDLPRGGGVGGSGGRRPAPPPGARATPGGPDGG